MLTKLSEILKRYAKGWLVLVFFALDALFNVVIMSGVQARLEAASGGVGPIDLQFFYTPEKAYSMVAAYGAAGRAMYRTFELTGDILYPIVYTLFFSLVLTWLLQRGFAANSQIQRLNVVPFGAWLFDLLENVGIVTMLSIYPATPALIAWLTAICTLIKWSFIGATIVLTLASLVMMAKNTLLKKQ